MDRDATKTLSAIVAGLPAGLKARPFRTGSDLGFLLPLPADLLAAGGIAGLTLPGMARFMALGKYCPWWLHALHGSRETGFGVLREPCLYLLWERADGGYGLLLPLADAGLRAVLIHDGQAGIRLRVEGGLAGAPPPRAATLLFAGTGPDPYRLCQNAVTWAAETLRTFRIRTEKPAPEFADYLGWCTWDAFRHEVDEAKVLAGLDSWKRARFPLKFFLLDDGWLDAKDGLLRGWDANAKFPSGLGGLVAKAKRDYGLRLFGVWHALQGWWRGVDPQGPLGARFRTLVTRDEQPGDTGYAAGTIRALVHPDDSYRFFQEWHAHLRQCGVDMVKVDNHSSLDEFGKGSVGPAAAMATYQRALQSSAQMHFLGNLLHCMGNAGDVAYAMQSSLAWRNSEDHNPGWPAGHQYHVFNNAMNNLWSSAFALPDWDMFQSHLEAGPYHAAARAISGGPIYVADLPGRQDFALLRKLCTSDGRILRCAAPALPARDCLFANCAGAPRLMKITNRNGAIGVLGLFHCYWKGDGLKARVEDQQPVTDTFQPDDIPYLRGAQFALYFHQTRRLALGARRSRHRLTLPWRGFEIVTVAPVAGGIACLGLLDKFNGSRAIERSEWRGTRELAVDLRDGGEIGCYCRRRPRRVALNGRVAAPAYDRKTGLLVVRAKAGRPCQLLVTL